jgi:hypothetical protein
VVLAKYLGEGTSREQQRQLCCSCFFLVGPIRLHSKTLKQGVAVKTLLRFYLAGARRESAAGVTHLVNLEAGPLARWCPSGAAAQTLRIQLMAIGILG